MTYARTPFNLEQAVVCITGGSSGIGQGLAKEFLAAGSTVIITGRRSAALQAAKEALPGVHTFEGDVGQPAERSRLAAWLVNTFPRINVLVNNAGIQRRVTAPNETDDWSGRQAEFAINLEAPIHLMHLLSPHFLQQREACFVNITGGLAFVPASFAPAYGATKAALHSFTMASRWAYANTGIRLVELAPPSVVSHLGGSHDFGEPCDEFCASVFKRFAAGELEIGYKQSEDMRSLSRAKADELCNSLATRMQPAQYAVTHLTVV